MKLRTRTRQFDFTLQAKQVYWRRSMNGVRYFLWRASLEVKFFQFHLPLSAKGEYES